mmetsp:Transcript_33175/g.106448  ORF Transcript_33175/g.106448 Transcript_33175/m.106448 type:complete len:179 (-) Transcript_33175:265-801(-)
MSPAFALTGTISLAQLLLHHRAPPPPPRPPPWWLPVQPPLPPSAPAPPASPSMWNPTKAGRAASKAWMRALPAWLNRPASGVAQQPPASAPSPPLVLQPCTELQLREITNGWTSTSGCLWPLASGRFGSCLTPGANTGSYTEFWRVSEWQCQHKCEDDPMCVAIEFSYIDHSTALRLL